MSSFLEMFVMNLGTKKPLNLTILCQQALVFWYRRLNIYKLKNLTSIQYVYG